MTTDLRSFIDKLASANFGNVVRWTLDRVQGVRHWLSWHAARLRIEAYALLPLRGRLPPGPLALSAYRDAVRDDRFYMKQYGRHGRYSSSSGGPDTSRCASSATRLPGACCNNTAVPWVQ